MQEVNGLIYVSVDGTHSAVSPLGVVGFQVVAVVRHIPASADRSSAHSPMTSRGPACQRVDGQGEPAAMVHRPERFTTQGLSAALSIEPKRILAERLRADRQV
jgi:hypothetical protein